jgi:hypothetical protein
MKTAMQTLISQIETEINKEGNGAMAIGFDSGLKKAKQLAEELLEMENEQIGDAWDSAYGGDSYYSGESYYNGTFKQQEQ